MLGVDKGIEQSTDLKVGTAQLQTESLFWEKKACLLIEYTFCTSWSTGTGLISPPAPGTNHQSTLKPQKWVEVMDQHTLAFPMHANIPLASAKWLTWLDILLPVE